MVHKKVKLNNETGLHARPAALLVDVANKFEAQLKISYGNQEANLKSIISLMSLAIGSGEEVVIKGSGADEEEAVNKIVSIIEQDFSLQD
ncbi:HPr family phosphocarrier protein [Halanaerobaculum tunisiense]